MVSLTNQMSMTHKKTKARLVVLPSYAISISVAFIWIKLSPFFEDTEVVARKFSFKTFTLGAGCKIDQSRFVLFLDVSVYFFFTMHRDVQLFYSLKLKTRLLVIMMIVILKVVYYFISTVS